MGAGGTGIIDIMISRMGRGWCFTFIALVCIVTMPLLWVELKWGPVWREERWLRLNSIAEKEKGREGLRIVSAERTEGEDNVSKKRGYCVEKG
jgi:hypothetical protein